MAKKLFTKIISFFIKLLQASRNLGGGTLIAVAAYFISLLMPELPALVIQVVGLFIFAWSIMYTIITRFHKAVHNVKQAYQETRGNDADEEQE